MDLAVRLRDEMAGTVDKGVGSGDEEEVASQELPGLDELLLGLLEIEIDVEGLNEIGDGIAVFIVLLLHDANQILQVFLIRSRVSISAPIDDDGNGQVAQDPRTAGLNGVDVRKGEEEFQDGVTSRVEVEEGKETPMDEPGTMLQLCERGVEELISGAHVSDDGSVSGGGGGGCSTANLGLDGLLETLNLLHGRFPIPAEDLARQLSPSSGDDLVGIGRLSHVSHASG